MSGSERLYFARLYILLCDQAGVTPQSQPWFPDEYLSNGSENSDRTRSRRTMFYKTTRESYAFKEDDDGRIVGMYQRGYKEVRGATQANG